MTDHEAFVRLSSVLTGIRASELPLLSDQRDSLGTELKLYELYFERLRSAYPSEFAELLSAWAIVKDGTDPETALAAKLSQKTPAALQLRVAARQVVKLWYLSTIDDPRKALDPSKKGRNNGNLGGDLGQYASSAIYRLIGAPVPGYSNCQHGYWKDPPTLPPE
jgi:hypothetical protein